MKLTFHPNQTANLSFTPSSEAVRLTSTSIKFSIQIRYKWDTSNSSTEGTGNHLVQRMLGLAVARHLQHKRYVDIVELRNALGASDGINHKASRFFQGLYNNGAVEKTVAGIDTNGFPYQRWTLIDSGKAKRYFLDRAIKPLRKGAMLKWCSESELETRQEPA